MLNKINLLATLKFPKFPDHISIDYDQNIVTRYILSGNAVNVKAANDHNAIYVEKVHEGAHILWDYDLGPWGR